MTESDVFERSSRDSGRADQRVLDTAPSELIVFLGERRNGSTAGPDCWRALGELRAPTRPPAMSARRCWMPSGSSPSRRERRGSCPSSSDGCSTSRRSSLIATSRAPGGRRLGAALASLGADLVEGAPLVLDLIGFRDRLSGVDLVVGEGTVDRSTFMGKAPAADRGSQAVEMRPLRRACTRAAARRRDLRAQRGSRAGARRPRRAGPEAQCDGAYVLTADWRSFQASDGVSSTMGRNSQKVMP